MTKTFDLYGSSLDLVPALREAEAALGVTFHPHESSYHGGDYYRHSERFILQRNAELNDALAEPEFASATTLLYVSGVPDPDIIRRQIVGASTFEHLRRDLV